MNPLIGKDVGEPQADSVTPFITDGTWSLYELIGYLLTYTGPADVFLTSFSISDDSLRYLLALKEQGQIKHLKGLFDSSLRKTKTPLLYFAQSVFDAFRLTLNHSKLVLFAGEKMHLTVFASANLGRNRRIEAGFLDARPATFNQMHNKLSELYSNAVEL
jgi:hypothetical protein